MTSPDSARGGARHFQRAPIDLSHNCARDPEKKPRERQCRAKDFARTAESPVFSYGETRDGVLVDFVFQAVVALAFPYFS